jgi:hypothetical protein
MGHHQATFFVSGETTALYTLSSVSLSILLLLLLVYFIERREDSTKSIHNKVNDIKTLKQPPEKNKMEVFYERNYSP